MPNKNHANSNPFFFYGWEFNPRRDRFEFQVRCRLCPQDVGVVVLYEEINAASTEKIEELVKTTPKRVKEFLEQNGCTHTDLVPAENWEPTANDLEFLEILRERKRDAR